MRRFKSIIDKHSWRCEEHLSFINLIGGLYKFDHPHENRNKYLTRVPEKIINKKT